MPRNTRTKKSFIKSPNNPLDNNSNKKRSRQIVLCYYTKCKGKIVDLRTMKKHELKKKLIPTLRGINKNLGQVSSQDDQMKIDTPSSSNEEIEPIELIEPKLLFFD